MTPPECVPEEAFRMAMRELRGCDFLPEELDRALTAAAPAIREQRDDELRERLQREVDRCRCKGHPLAQAAIANIGRAIFKDPTQ